MFLQTYVYIRAYAIDEAEMLCATLVVLGGLCALATLLLWESKELVAGFIVLVFVVGPSIDNIDALSYFLVFGVGFAIAFLALYPFLKSVKVTAPITSFVELVVCAGGWSIVGEHYEEYALVFHIGVCSVSRALGGEPQNDGKTQILIFSTLAFLTETVYRMAGGRATLPPVWVVLILTVSLHLASAEINHVLYTRETR